MKKKYLETLQLNILNSYYEKRKHTCIFKQQGLFNSFIHVFLFRFFRHTIKPGTPEHGTSAVIKSKVQTNCYT